MEVVFVGKRLWISIEDIEPLFRSRAVSASTTACDLAVSCTPVWCARTGTGGWVSTDLSQRNWFRYGDPLVIPPRRIVSVLSIPGQKQSLMARNRDRGGETKNKDYVLLEGLALDGRTGALCTSWQNSPSKTWWPISDRRTVPSPRHVPAECRIFVFHSEESVLAYWFCSFFLSLLPFQLGCKWYMFRVTIQKIDKINYSSIPCK